MLRRVLLAVSSVVVVLLGVGLAYPAAAVDVVTTKRQVLGPETVSFAAGEYCSFPVLVTMQNFGLNQMVYDSSGNLLRMKWQFNATLTTKNATTWKSITERDHYTIVWDYEAQQMAYTGQVMHAFAADGKLYINAAGRAVIDLASGALVSYTPNSMMDGEYLARTCAYIAQ